ncbi:MAG: zinc metalloprotease HtpX [Candidatus Firestonebacteria bacterium RIFOXYC2_FULL_39_67]|nr:MAG: zinc metalloprotease HtpX [Candidatus Firestonebacteria bacterium RIFOXYD2_FULL_39_29]OGF51951.1 MAG: zinc metalloprotease HtpX [Candidatus Firestonebacteria bacterium RifOxyC12_full_39_7]OGF54832.1 MAG: zinc metalloprotease HtpX [Candidatus Firestonebacteria bacterium RIFOXYC2_FULL_39_67]
MLYEEISSNKYKTAFLVILFVILVLFLGYVFGEVSGFGHFGFLLAAMISFIMAWGSYYYSDQIVLSISHAVPADPKDHAYLINTVEGLCLAAGLPRPKVYVIYDTAPNAFATGRDPSHAAVVFTTGIIEKLNRQELEGVIAHELSHVKNYDILISTVSVVMVGTVTLLSDWMLRNVRWSKLGGRGRGSGGYLGLALLLASIILAILSPFIAQLMHFAISRRREFQADASAALLTRYPPGLASALEKISKDTEPLEVANKATAHLFIANPFKNIGGMTSKLFDTHPPIEERIKILKAM